MKPGTLPCPSVPQKNPLPTDTATDQYGKLSGPELIDKAKVYTCKYGELQLYGTPVDPMDEIVSLICRPDTGHFWRKYKSGKEVYVQPAEQFVCRENPCPPDDHERDPVTVPKPFAITNCQVTTVRTDDATILTCPPGGVLYDVTNENMPTIVTPENVPKCIRDSTKWSITSKVYKCLTTPSAFMEPDPCEPELFPGKLRIDTLRICENDDWPETYVIRGIDESGKFVTLDNDGPRFLQYDMTRGECGAWAYKDSQPDLGHDRPIVYLKALTCAKADASPCACTTPPKLKAGGVAVMTGDGPICQSGYHLEYNLYKADGTFEVPAGNPSDLEFYRIKCMAGVWILANIEGGGTKYSGWTMDEAACFPNMMPG